MGEIVKFLIWLFKFLIWLVLEFPMVGFVKKGVRTSVALSREESERQAEAA